MNKRKNDAVVELNSNKVIMGVIVIAILMVTGILPLLIKLVFGVIGLVLGLVFGAIGLVLGLMAGAIGLVVGLLAGAIALVVGLAPILLPIAIVAYFVKKRNRSEKPKRKHDFDVDYA